MSIKNIDIINAAEQSDIISPALASAIRNNVPDAIKSSNALTNSFVDLLNRIVMLKVHGIKTVNRWKKCFRERIMFGSSLNFLTIGRALDRDIENLDTSSSYTVGITGGPDELKAKPEMVNKVRKGELSFKRYSVTITDEWLTYAIVNQFGIDEVTDKFVSSCDKSIDIDTDEQFFDFIKSEYVDDIGLGELGNSYKFNISGDGERGATFRDSKTLSLAILKTIHDTSSLFAYSNDNFNTGLIQSLPFEDMLLIIDFSVYNRLKIDTYSGAFNLNDLKIPVDNIIPVNMNFSYGENPTTGVCTPVGQILNENETDAIFGIICDKERYTIRDKLLAVKARYNEALLTTNIFHHIDRKFFSDYSRIACALTYKLAA